MIITKYLSNLCIIFSYCPSLWNGPGDKNNPQYQIANQATSVLAYRPLWRRKVVQASAKRKAPRSGASPVFVLARQSCPDDQLSTLDKSIGPLWRAAADKRLFMDGQILAPAPNSLNYLDSSSNSQPLAEFIDIALLQHDLGIPDRLYRCVQSKLADELFGRADDFSLIHSGRIISFACACEIQNAPPQRRGQWLG